jgi:hypothetical protein
MRCVHLWKCECGARLKVISETEAHPPGRHFAQVQNKAACPRCGKTTPLDGQILQVFVEDDTTAWMNPPS